MKSRCLPNGGAVSPYQGALKPSQIFNKWRTIDAKKEDASLWRHTHTRSHSVSKSNADCKNVRSFLCVVIIRGKTWRFIGRTSVSPVHCDECVVYILYMLFKQIFVSGIWERFSKYTWMQHKYTINLQFC